MKNKKILAGNNKMNFQKRRKKTSLRYPEFYLAPVFLTISHPHILQHKILQFSLIKTEFMNKPLY